ncbi:flagellar assembly protein FliH [Pseudescherichia sp.]|uniref:flagellar assembly protein FliH n=1 Tax=Pseudescherichia sp. TaxID=2055881 RepID=UPI00289F9D2C|nr:flagellar assembly protein FliH [Pseudescherichia sp.]
MQTLRGRYRLHRFPPRNAAAQRAAPGGGSADFQRQLMDGYQQGLQKGFAEGVSEGQETGFQEGLAKGEAEGYRQGFAEGSLVGQRDGLAQFTQAAQPLEAIVGSLNDYFAHLQRKQREDLLQLVEKVTRQVIRCELALQPTQLLALVEEAIAAMPAVPDPLKVYLSTDEFSRIQSVAPEKVNAWGLTASTELAAGECRIVTDASELDVGCGHRLEQCMTVLKETLTPEETDEHSASL